MLSTPNVHLFLWANDCSFNSLNLVSYGESFRFGTSFVANASYKIDAESERLAMYETRLRESKLPSWAHRWLRGDAIQIFKLVK